MHHEFVHRFRGVCHIDFAVSLPEIGLRVVSESIGHAVHGSSLDLLRDVGQCAHMVKMKAREGKIQK